MEGSYARAFRRLGSQVTHWDVPAAIRRRVRGGRLGSFINDFWPSEAWIAKANRDLLTLVFKVKPDILLVGGANRVTAGALAQIRATLPDCRLVLIWPDPMIYCFSNVVQSLPLYDLVATYSKATVEPFLRLGAAKAAWVPLGFDGELHPPHAPASGREAEFSDCDVSFIGDYTPEREELAVKFIKAGIRIKIWGPVAWRRAAADRKALRSYWQGGPVFGAEFSLAMRSAPLALNPINAVSYPTANMRFFEIPGCGGVPLSARCPEMEDEFPDGVACFYYDSPDGAVDIARRLLADDSVRRRVAREGRDRVWKGHTYVHRAIHILSLIGSASPVTAVGQSGR